MEDHQLPVTKNLNAMKRGDEAAAKDVYDYFWEEAKEFVERHFDQRLLKRTHSSTIARSALNKVMCESRDSPTAFENRNQFRKLLYKALKYKQVDIRRKHNAQKRSIDCEIERVTENSAVEVDSVLRHVIAQELLEKVRSLIEQEKDPLYRDIVILHLLEGKGPTEIHNLLENVFSNGGERPEGYPDKLPSLSTITIACRKWRTRAKNFLQSLDPETPDNN